MTEDERYEFENEQVEFTVTCRMRRRWARAFLSMLKYMQWCGDAGHSSYVGLYADGDGDFRPKFTESGFGPFRMSPPCIRNFSGSNCTFDADFTAEDLYASALSDKKRDGGYITLVVPYDVADARLVRVPVDALEGYIRTGLED